MTLRKYHKKKHGLQWFSILPCEGMKYYMTSPKKVLTLTTVAGDSQFIHINATYVAKNIKVSLSVKEFENISRAEIYENKDDEDHCPVACLTNYLSWIPTECNTLFPLLVKQYLRKKYWYCLYLLLGVNAIDSFMKNLLSLT